MRSALSAALAALAFTFATGWTHAQDAAGLPKAPVPYSRLHPKPRPKTPAPVPTPAQAPGSAEIAPTPHVEAAPAGPVAAPSPAAPPTIHTAATAPSRIAPGQAIPAAELEAFVDGMVKNAMAREHIAGVTVAIVQNGQIALKKGYGFASLSPQRAVDPDRTLFRVGSISKTFTWIALMKEVEAGRIRLNQPVNLYLPEKVQVKDQGFDQPVRVANLMDHSAGFEDRALGQLFERDAKRVRPLDVYLRQERPRRVRAPGVLSSYSNYGAALAGEAVTYTAGKPYERLVEDEILTPLGMTHTTFREPHPPQPGLPAPMSAMLAADVSDAFRGSSSGFRRRDYEFIGQVAPAGAGSSTAGDMARYMMMQLGGGQLNGVTIYGPTSATAFRTALRKTPPGVNGWAHGFSVRQLPGGYVGYGHDGATLSFFSNMVLAPDLNLGVFISTNTDTGGRLADQLPAAVVAEFYGGARTFPRAGSAELAAAASVFNGDYVSTRRAYSGLEGLVTAINGTSAIRITPDGRMIDSAGGTWVLDGPVDGGRFVAANGDPRTLVFSVRNGRAVSFIGSGGAAVFERTSIWRNAKTLATLAALAAFAALGTLVGIPLRNRREFRENQIQSRAGLIQNIQAALWIAAFAMAGLWFSKTGDITEIMYRWPGFLLITASACALVAAALTTVTFLVLPAVWRGGRRVDSWSQLRKTYFTLTVVIYGAFSIVLGLSGGLSPWGG